MILWDLGWHFTIISPSFISVFNHEHMGIQMINDGWLMVDETSTAVI